MAGFEDGGQGDGDGAGAGNPGTLGKRRPPLVLRSEPWAHKFLIFRCVGLGMKSVVYHPKL